MNKAEWNKLVVNENCFLKKKYILGIMCQVFGME